MGKIAGSCRVIEALQVVWGTVDWGHAVTSVCTVGNLCIAMCKDRWVCLGVGFSFAMN